GWPANSSGGAIKARNGQHLIISQNTLRNSGILLYEYDDDPPYLKFVVVSDNTIEDIPPIKDDKTFYHGIGYDRNNPNGAEESIRIEKNYLPGGYITISDTDFNAYNFNKTGGGVFNNTCKCVKMADKVNRNGTKCENKKC